jgi:hypothetical protein
MAGLPKLLLIVLVVFAVWYAVRAFNRMRPPAPPPQGRQGPQTQRMIEAEDLVSCRVCGTYIATSARHCGRAGCPQPR